MSRNNTNMAFARHCCWKTLYLLLLWSCSEVLANNSNASNIETASANQHSHIEQANNDHQKAYAIYLQLRSDTSLSRSERLKLWESIYSLLDPNTHSDFRTLALFKLSHISVQLRNEDSQKWISELQSLNEANPDQVLAYLLARVEFERLYQDGKYPEAIKNGQVLIQVSKLLDATDMNYLTADGLKVPRYEVAETVNTIGIAYFSTGKYEAAQTNFLNALEMYEDISYKRGIASSINNLSMISWAQNDFETALKYLSKSLKLSIELGDTFAIVTNLSNQGIYYTNLKQYDEAIASFDKVLKHPEIDLYPQTKLNASLTLAELHMETGDLATGKGIIKESLDLSQQIEDNLFLAHSMMLLGDIHLLEKNYQLAIPQYKQAIETYKESGMKRDASNVKRSLSETYAALGEYQKALEHFQSYHTISNELLTDAQKKTLLELQQKYEAETREEKIGQLQRENKLKAKAIESAKKQKIYLVFSIVCAFVVLLLSISRRYVRNEAEKLKQHNAEIASREKQLRLLSHAFSNTSDAVWICNELFEIEVVNSAHDTQTGKKSEDVIGQRVSFASVNGQDDTLASRLMALARDTGSWKGEIYDQKANGDIYPLEMEIEAIKNEQGELVHYLGVFRDITEKQKSQEQLIKLATYDDLTGLPNRTLIRELIQRSCFNAKTTQRSPAVLSIDLDGFKKINDSFGYDTGDKIICLVAKRLVNTLREKDVVARIAADEFCVLVELRNRDVAAASIAKKVVTSFDTPFEVDNTSFNLTASVGIAVYSDEEQDSDELLRKSGIAMYEVKNSGKNGYSFYETYMNTEVSAQLEYLQKIIKAMEEHQFEFHYQPLVDVTTGGITGAEALIRWPQKDGSLVSPDQFIPFAEKSGLIVRFDHIVIEDVFKQVSIWNKKDMRIDSVSINLSAKIFSQPDELIDLVEGALDTYGINAKSIKLEITEGMLLDNVERAIKTMEKLKALGFLLVVDDFGTGFSSLNYLKRFPIDILKVDRSFIMDMHASGKDRSIVQSIIDLAHNLELTVVAEGVEYDIQLNLLRDMKCEEYQGYYFSRPVDVNTFENLLNDKK